MLAVLRGFMYILVLTVVLFVFGAATLHVDPVVGKKSSSLIPLLKAVSPIECVLCDMDGTLLADNHCVLEVTKDSVANIIKSGLHFIPATGRTRKSTCSVTKSLLPSLLGKPEAGICGVFSQGLQIYGKDGHIIHEEFLSDSAIESVVSFCSKVGLSVVAYAGDDIYCTKRDTHTDSVTEYGDPAPIEYPDGIEHLEKGLGVRTNKLIVLAPEDVLTNKRPALSEHLSGSATITKAVPGMLEILPFGASKGKGVRRLLQPSGGRYQKNGCHWRRRE